MFQHHKKKLSALLLTLLLIAAPLTVFADGTTSIATSGNSAQVGDKVTVTVTGSDTSKLSLRYNNNVLKFQSCSASGYSTDGNVITFNGKSAQITFEATDGGSGDLVVSSDTLSGSSTSVQVAAAPAPQPEPEETETPEETASDTETDDADTEEADTDDDTSTSSNASTGDGDFTIDGTDYVLSERYADSEIPAGFSKTSMKIHGGTYRELTNGTLTLVYLKPADNIAGSGVFYVYDKDSDSVSDFSMLGTADYYVLLSEPDDLLTDRFVEAKVKANDAKYDAWQLGETESSFYYVYGTDNRGTTGWFSYDAEEETVQRANEELLTSGVPASVAEEEENTSVQKEKKKSGGSFDFDFDELMDTLATSRNLLAVGIFALVVLFIIILDILLFRRKRDDYDDDYDEDDDEPENGEPEVMTVDNILEADDFEEANKPHKNKKFFGRDRQTDIWDTADGRLSDTGELPFQKDESSKLKKQVFRGRNKDSGADGEDGKVDVIDFNDL